MKTKIFNLIVIDESGSMYVIEKEALGSVNETIQTIRSAQKEYEDQEHYVSIVTFNNKVKTVVDCVHVDEVADIAVGEYRPNGCTALYDAMGFSLMALRERVADEDGVLVTVVTDGLENASTEYRGETIKALVEELKSRGWVFAYIGANQDVAAVAASMSIANSMKFEATSEGAVEMSRKWNFARGKLYDSMACGNFCANDANENFFDDGNV